MAFVAYRKNDAVNNPFTGSPIFTIFPEIVLKGHSFPKASVFLRFGDRRFGVSHIWDEHRKDISTIRHMTVLDHNSVYEIARYVATILRTGGDIYCEFSDPGGNHRPLVFRSSAGLVVLDRKVDGSGQDFYSVVTAYPGKAKGTKIGALRVPS